MFGIGSTFGTVLGILAMIFGAIFGFFVLFWIIGAIFKGIGWALEGIGRFIAHVFECVRGIVVEAVRAVGAIINAVILLPMSLMNGLLGRGSATKHFLRSAGDELRSAGSSIYRSSIGWPLRLIGFGFALDNLEARMLETIERAPRVEPGELDFKGYVVESRLPQGGSGAQLFLARPTDEHRARLAQQGIDLAPRVVIKAFGLSFGSSLPQMMRENRALESARKMGLVFEHSSEGDRFYYVMPYVPGDDLGIVTRRLHERCGTAGLDDTALAAVLSYTANLLGILGRFHAAGVWHKDIKPSNIVVNGDRVELIDLGLVTPLASAMTLTTHGTEYYRDPELVRQAMRGVKVHEVDGVKFDLYSVGAVIFSMVEDSFPAHGNLSRFTRRCPSALSWIVRRAMAEASQRYGSTEQMLADVAKVVAAPDPFAVRPADLPSMGGEPVELPNIPDAPLPPLRRTGPPPLPHERVRHEREQQRRGLHEERGAGRRRRAEAREAHRRERAQRRQERPRRLHAFTGAAFMLFALFLTGAFAFALLGAREVDYYEDGPVAQAMPAPMGRPSAFDRGNDAGVNVYETTARLETHPDPHAKVVVTGEQPMVLLLPEVPPELLGDAEQAHLVALTAALESQLGWQILSEVSARDFEGIDEEGLLADARFAALMRQVGDPSSAIRIEAFLAAAPELDGVLWIGFDPENGIGRHLLVVPEEERGLERRTIERRSFSRRLVEILD